VRISIRYDTDQSPGQHASRPPDLCNVDLYVNTREDLVQAQYLINALLEVLPSLPSAKIHNIGE
jgi:hypothetical protein